MTNISITIASPPDRDDLVAELWLGDNQIGEVSRDTKDALWVELYPALNNEPWRLHLDDLTTALARAKERLGG
jgi:hypothetical protein